MRLLIILAGGPAACGGNGGAGDYQEEYGGLRSTYNRIAELDDCAELQAEFDAFAAVNEANEAGSDMARQAGYMSATEDRRQELGC
ncbi:MAG: hypothetical protein ACRDGD_07300 [Candidatus Limnocylindria bacterium]